MRAYPQRHTIIRHKILQSARARVTIFGGGFIASRCGAAFIRISLLFYRHPCCDVVLTSTSSLGAPWIIFFVAPCSLLRPAKHGGKKTNIIKVILVAITTHLFIARPCEFDIAVAQNFWPMFRPWCCILIVTSACKIIVSDDILARRWEMVSRFFEESRDTRRIRSPTSYEP